MASGSHVWWWCPTVTEVHGDDHRTGWSSKYWLDARPDAMKSCETWEDLADMLVKAMWRPDIVDFHMAKRLRHPSSSFFMGAVVPGTGQKCPPFGDFVPAAFIKLEGAMEILNVDSLRSCTDITFKTKTGEILRDDDVHLVCVCMERSTYHAASVSADSPPQASGCVRSLQ